MKVNAVYQCLTCSFVLAQLRPECEATNAEEALTECKTAEALATGGPTLCPRCSRVLREDGTPYGDTWKLHYIQIDDGDTWIRAPL